MLLNVILNNNGLYRNNPISEHLPVSDAEEHGFYNKNVPQNIKCWFVVCSFSADYVSSCDCLLCSGIIVAKLTVANSAQCS